VQAECLSQARDVPGIGIFNPVDLGHLIVSTESPPSPVTISATMLG
jgi:hypothetical protein